MKNCEMILAGFWRSGDLFTGKILVFAAMLKDKTFLATVIHGPETRSGTRKLSRYNR